MDLKHKKTKAMAYACRKCVHGIPFQQIELMHCINPKIREVIEGEEEPGLVKILQVANDMKIIADARAKMFMWPGSFEDRWLISCNGFEQKGQDDVEEDRVLDK